MNIGVRLGSTFFTAQKRKFHMRTHKQRGRDGPGRSKRNKYSTPPQKKLQGISRCLKICFFCLCFCAPYNLDTSTDQSLSWVFARNENIHQQTDVGREKRHVGKQLQTNNKGRKYIKTRHTPTAEAHSPPSGQVPLAPPPCHPEPASPGGRSGRAASRHRHRRRRRRTSAGRQNPSHTKSC